MISMAFGRDNVEPAVPSHLVQDMLHSCTVSFVSDGSSGLKVVRSRCRLLGIDLDYGLCYILLDEADNLPHMLRSLTHTLHRSLPRSSSPLNRRSFATMDVGTSSSSGSSQKLHSITTHQQYEAPPLDIPSLKPSPIEQFSVWFSEAQEHGVPEPEAFSVATVDAATLSPSVRMVLFKQVDETGFVFFTNYESRKGKELGMSPDLDKEYGNRVAGAWYWKEMSRSVRVVGRAQRLSASESNKYYSTRPVGSQIGAHASPQSRVVASRRELEQYVEQCEGKYGIAAGSASRKADDPQDHGKSVPLPKNWGGVRIVPDEVEFWVGRPNR